MWNRKDLKTKAKDALKGRYWLAFLVSILAVVLISGSLLAEKHDLEIGDFIVNNNELLILAFAIISLIGLIAMAIMIAYCIFISSPVIVGHKKFYLANRRGKAEAGKILSSFSKDYKNIVKVMFFKNLRILLWSLLLIVPGIIKAIEYMAVDYLLAEYPKMSLDRALKLSSEITMGQKWNIFKLWLSFFGWFVLCFITGGLGFIFLNPYLQATLAELYSALIEKPINEKLFDPEERAEIAEAE